MLHYKDADIASCVTQNHEIYLWIFSILLGKIALAGRPSRPEGLICNRRRLQTSKMHDQVGHDIGFDLLYLQSFFMCLVFLLQRKECHNEAALPSLQPSSQPAPYPETDRNHNRNPYRLLTTTYQSCL